jgi:hypothetical protein
MFQSSFLEMVFHQFQTAAGARCCRKAQLISRAKTRELKNKGKRAQAPSPCFVFRSTISKVDIIKLFARFVKSKGGSGASMLRGAKALA